MKSSKFLFSSVIFIAIVLLSSLSVFADDVILIRSSDSPLVLDGHNYKRTRVYIPLTASFEYGELGLFFESNVGMCNVSIEDENGNVQMSETIDTDNGTEFWFDLSGLSSGLHYVKISYGSMNLVGEFYVE